LPSSREVAFLGRCSVRLGCYVSQFFVFMERSQALVRVRGGVKDVAAIK